MRLNLEQFAHTGDGVWAVDAEHRIVLWNDAAENLLGWTASQVMGKMCHELMAGRAPDGTPHCGSVCGPWRALQEGQVVEAFDFHTHHADGHPLVINVSVVKVLPPSGRSAEAVMVHIFRVLRDGDDWPAPLRISLLGAVRVTRVDGTIVGGDLWQRAKVRALLVLLAVHRGRPVRRDFLLEVLWSDLDRDQALRNLNTTIYNLRRSLEPNLRQGAESQYIHHMSDAYVLAGGRSHWLDVDAFEDRIARARQENDRDRAREYYEGALRLYRGAYLGDLDADLLDAWGERERFRQLYLNGLEELAALWAQEHEYRQAVELYLKALSEDPLRESATRALMRMSLRQGDRAAAIQHYRRLGEALLRDLGVPPSEQTKELYQTLVQDS